MTDSKGNTYTYTGTGGGGGASTAGAAVYYNNAGTRGASHTFTFNGPGTTTIVNVSVIEITGQDLSTPFDSTTDATATDATTPFNVTAGGAINGNQIAIYACTPSVGAEDTFNHPGGYSNIFTQSSGTFLVSIASYKLNETGTPTVGATRSGPAPSNAVEVFATFKEAGAGGGDDPTTPLRKLPLFIGRRG